MNNKKVLLNAYYEFLHETLQSNKGYLTKRIKELLIKRIADYHFELNTPEKVEAYYDACMAFLEERIETYNPIGFQYTLGPIRSKQAINLELQLDWYDKQTEFKNFMALIHKKAKQGITDKQLPAKVTELVWEIGAFPDKSIISAYRAQPALNKLPDYVVASAIEELIS